MPLTKFLEWGFTTFLRASLSTNLGLLVQDDLHEVGDAPGHVADDEHDGDGDGRARDARLALAQNVLAAPAQVLLRHAVGRRAGEGGVVAAEEGAARRAVAS